jgi:Transposase IS66 family
VNGYAQFKDEKSAIIKAGLSTTPFQHIDDTGAKVDGKQNYMHVLCNQFYTAYFTRPNKSRLTILEILSGGNLEFKFDNQAYHLMRSLQLSAQSVSELQARITLDAVLNRDQLTTILDELYPNSPRRSQIATEASAIPAYQSREDAIEILLCDDAPQFKQITEELALCWVHEARHYKKLIPIVAEYRQEVNMFLGKLWDYYRELLKFKAPPNGEDAERLSTQFDKLFTMPVKYRVLSGCMDRTYAKKHELLTVLRHPELPLHNNPAEHGARAQARKRDISFHTKTVTGTLSKDALMTIVQTARKLRVNIYQYVHDRISQTMIMRSLADEILIQSCVT